LNAWSPLSKTKYAGRTTTTMGIMGLGNGNPDPAHSDSDWDGRQTPKSREQDTH